MDVKQSMKKDETHKLPALESTAGQENKRADIECNRIEKL